MIVTILHSPNVETSRDVVLGLGRDPLSLDTVTIKSGTKDITVIAAHEECVRFLPNFGAYPVVIVDDAVSKDRYAKSGVTSMQDALDFMNAPGAEYKVQVP